MNETEAENIIEIDIAIIGAGPAGVAAAIELSKKGHSKGMILFDREAEVAMTSRHCNHQGFGVLEFKRPLSGEAYANRLAQEAEKYFVNKKLKHSLTKIDDDLLTFSSTDGEVQYRAKRVLFAMGARETTRTDMLVSGGRSPNIITTGALQRFTYIQERQPFTKAVIIGSEIVSFSAIMTAKHAGIEIAAIVEEQEQVKTFGLLKYASKYLLKTPVYTSSKLVSINTKNKEVQSVTISTNGIEQTIECDGVIFSGDFIPESSLLHKHFPDFNLQNYSLDVAHNFQTKDKRFFVAGNVLRGALTAFNCYFEGQKAGRAIAESLSKDAGSSLIKLEVDSEIGWSYPTLINVDIEHDDLTKIRFHRRTKGALKILLNGKEVMIQKIDAVPHMSITVDWFNRDIKEGDSIELVYQEA